MIKKKNKQFFLTVILYNSEKSYSNILEFRIWKTLSVSNYLGSHQPESIE